MAPITMVLSAVVSYSEYMLIPNATLPWADGVQYNDVNAAMAACTANASCSAVTSTGMTKFCKGGRCTCELDGNSCPERSSTEGLYLKTNPSTLQYPTTDAIRQGVLDSTIYYDTALHQSRSLCYQPEIGNGYTATNVNWDAMYISGLYNGKCGSVHKARIPSFLLVDIEGAVETENWLDIESAIFVKKWRVGGGNVEQRFYAHRTNRHLVVMEFIADADVEFTLKDNLNIQSENLSNAPGNRCAGSFTTDFVWKVNTGTNYTDFVGVTTEENDAGDKFTLTVRRDAVPRGAVKLTKDEVLALKVTLLTSLPDDSKEDISRLHVLTPFSDHVDGWRELQQSGVDLFPAVGERSATTDNQTIILSSLGLDFNSANSISRHVNSSLYFLRSSLRADWNHGISPGGISTQNYQGAVFFDMDTYMSPSLLLLNHNLTKSCLRYRFNSLNETRRIADMFGFKGTQFAWTSAYHGAPFGCCSGKGTLEDCLEQHITGDVGVAVWQYYTASNDTVWLREVGYPILEGVKDWVVSRGVANYSSDNKTLTSFDISGILPVDEWCVGSGCGCETPGVVNDAQTNAVMKLSVGFFLEATEVLQIQLPAGEGERLEAIYNKIPLLHNSTHNRHNQFTSPTCPDGFGGTHYSERHTVCPDDVMYLTYPFGDFLNTSATVSKNDYDFFVPITCKENSGMTTPIHSISQLTFKTEGLFNEGDFEGEFYRSMYAGSYGAYNVRNEVDKHPNIIGGHFDNSHFLTGDGGFVHIFVYGYSGMRLVSDGLKLLRPSFPQNTSGLRVRGAQWRGRVINFEVTEGRSSITVVGGPSTDLCVVGANGAVLRFQNDQVTMDTENFPYPGLLRTCP